MSMFCHIIINGEPLVNATLNDALMEEIGDKIKISSVGFEEYIPKDAAKEVNEEGDEIYTLTNGIQFILSFI